MQTLIQDIRFGLRMLFKHRGMTIAAILALALGIGANTTMFTIINAVLLRPLPFPQPERLVHLDETSPKKGLDTMTLSLPDFADWRDQSQSFAAMAAYAEDSFTLSGTDKAERITGARVTADLFPLLGIAAAQGRHFLAQEDKAGAPPVVIISQGLWQRRFGGNPNLVGQNLKIDGRSATVIGIMPVDFKFPVSADMWLPLTLEINEQDRGHHFCYGIGRLKSGVTLEQARAEIAGISTRIAQTHAGTNADVESVIKSWRDFVVEDVDQVLWLLMGVVGFVLLIACANVANLMLARAAARQKEMAIRAALGASRWRVMRQLLTESVLLAVMGGALGLMLTLWGVDWMMKAIPDAVPTWIKFTIDARVFSFTCIAVLVTSVLFGLAPAWQAAKPDLNDVLKDSGRSGSGVWGRHRLRSLLVVSEVALALVLLVGAGLMMKSFLRLRQVNPGFRAERVLTAKLSLPETQYPEAAQQTRFYQRLLQRVATLPGVESVAVTSNLPLSTEYSGSGFTVEGQPPPADSSQIPIANYGIVSPSYFRVMGMTLHAGRDFTEADTGNQPPVVIIDEALARRYFAHENPLGKRIKFGGPQSGRPWLTIVGVVNAVKHWGLKEEVKMTAYLPYQQKARGEMVLVAHTLGDPTALTAALRSEVAALDKDLPLYAERSMEQVVALSIWDDKYYGLLFGMFAALALVLAAVGIYGVMSYSVTQRTHELGVRVALGAQTSDVLKLVVRQGMTLTMIGVAIGLAAAFGLTRLMSSLLFDVKATDPLTFVFISLLLAAVALLACYIPARRATKVDPMIALRYE